MVNQRMWTHWRMANELYTMKCYLMLEGFLFFSLYSVSFLAKQQMALT